MVLKLEHFRKHIRVPGNFWNVALVKDGEDRLERSLRNEEVLHTVKKKRNNLHTRTMKRKTNWTGHNLKTNCLLLEGKIEGRKKWRKDEERNGQVLETFREKKDTKKLKEEALNGTPQKPNFGRGYGPVEWLQHEWTTAKD